MPYPLIDKALLANLRLAHGAFNATMLLFFLYQGMLGFRIRRDRLAGAPLPLSVIKRHRKAGPILTVLGGLGFLGGISVVLLDKGHILAFPPHFLTGLTIVVLLIATFRISRDIKGPDSSFRRPHFILGIAVLCMYALNVLFGIGILL